MTIAILLITIQKKVKVMKMSKNNLQYIKEKLENFFVILIVFQPLLDVLAYFDIPISRAFRPIILLIGMLYILVIENKKAKKYTMIYLVTVGLFMILSLVNNFLLKENFAFFSEINLIVRTLYFIELLIVYFFVFQSIKQNKGYWEIKVFRNIFYSMTIIGVVMLIATLTNTGERSYGALAKLGHSGWFFSANDLSAILAMCFGLVLLYLSYKERLSDKLRLLPIVVLISWAMLMIGTKVALGGLIIGFGTFLAIILFKSIKNRKELSNFIIYSVVFVGIVLYIPFSPVGNNLNLSFSLINEGKNTSVVENGVTNTNNDEIENGESNDKSKQGMDVLLSGRKDYLINTLDYYKKSPLSQQILGLGYRGGLENIPKVVEMDFFDWLFSFGVLGFSLFVIPVIFTFVYFIRQLIKNKINTINIMNLVIITIEVGLGFGISLVAGHILMYPASGFYLALLIGLLCATVTPKKNVKENVIN